MRRSYEALATHIPKSQADELKEKFAALRSMPTHIQRSRETEGYSWSARSLGEPKMGEDNPLEGPSRVRFIECWLKSGGMHRIGRVKVELQYIFEGSSIFTSPDEEYEAADLVVGEEMVIQRKLLMEGAGTLDGSEFYADQAYRLTAKMLFLSDGTGRGMLQRQESENVPYIVGLDEGVPIEVLQVFGRSVERHAEEYARESIGPEIADDLTATLGCFIELEHVRVAQREAEGSIYYRSA